MTKIKKTPLMRILAVLTAVLLAILVLPEVAFAEDTITVGDTTYTVIATNTNALTITSSSLKDNTKQDLTDSSSLSDGDTIYVDVAFKITNASAGTVNQSSEGTVTAVTVYRTEVDLTNIDLASYSWQSFTSGTKSGYWRFVTEDDVTYLEVIVTSTDNNSDIEGSMELTGTVSTIDWSNNTGNYSTIDLGFGAASATVQYNNPGSLVVEKSASGEAVYSDADRTYTQEWTVTLTPSSTGYVNVVGFSDSSTPSGTLSGDVTLSVNGSETTYNSFENLVTYLQTLYLTNSDSVTVTYSTVYSAADVAENSGATNKAEVTYNDDATAADYANLNATVPSVSKTSSTSGNTITYTIAYTWDGFTGTAGTDASYVTDVSDTITMSGNSAYSESISIPDLNSDSWTWEGSTQTWTYTYTYTPTDEQLIYYSQYTNTITAKINGYEVTSENKSGWFCNDYISKKGEYNSTDNTITWTVTFTVPYAMDLSDVTINDSGSAGTYKSGSASAALTGSASADLTVTGDGSSFTFSGYDSELSKGDVITLTYTTTVTDPTQTSSTVTYRNTATPDFPVPDGWSSPSQSETASVTVESLSNDILTKTGENYGYQDGVNFTLSVNTNTLATGSTITITDQLSIPETDTTSNTNYLYTAWQNYVAEHGEDYASAFGLTVTSSSGGTVTAGSISSTGGITFTVDNITQGTSVSIGYKITFSNLLKSYIYAAYDAALAANAYANPGFAVYNTATAKVGSTTYNTDDAVSTTYYDYPTPTDELEKTAVYRTDGNSTNEYDYVETANDTVVYTLKVNEDGYTLNGGDSLTLTDTLGSGLALWDESDVKAANVAGTLASYNYVSGINDYDTYYQGVSSTAVSNVLVFKEETYSKSYYSGFYPTYYTLLTKDVDYTYTYDTSTNTITFNVPDGESLLIVYYCEVTIGSGTYLNGELSNSATLTGSNSTSVGSDDVTYTVSYKSTSSLSGVQNYLVVNKQSSIGTQSIYGATFSVTPVNSDGSATGNASYFTVTEDSNTVTLNSDTYYKLEEIYAPKGYTLSGEVYYVYFQSQNAPTVNSIDNKPVQVYNSASNDSYATLTSISINMAANAELTITASNGGSLSDNNFGTTSYNYKANVTSNTSATVTYGNASWSLLLQNLTAGTYTLTSGNETCTVVVATNGTVTLSDTTSGSYLTNVSIGSVSGEQAVSNTPNNQLTIKKVNDTGTALSGATFTLASTSNADLSNVVVTTDNGTTYTTIGDGTSAITSYTFTTNGSDLVLYGLPDGYYTLTEDSAPDGYTEVDPITFSVSGSEIAQTNATVANVEYRSNTFTITDVSGTQTAEIVVSKKDEGGSNLAGAEFTLTATSGGSSVDLGSVTVTGAASSSYSSNTWTFTTDTSNITLTGLPDGEYTLTETAAPNGYILANTTVTFTVTSGEVTAETDSSSYVTVDGTDTTKATVTLTNTLTSITVSKVDKDNQSTYLTGAVFTVALTGGSYFDASNVTVTSGSTVSSTESSVTSLTLNMGTNSTVTISGLPAGNYTLTETTAPNGYVVSGTAATMTVSGTGASTGVTITNSKTPTAEITIHKVNESGSNLAGAKFTLTATSGSSPVNLSGVTVTDAASSSYSSDTLTFTTGTSNITLTGLPDGEYTLTETAAPNGYILANTTVTFTVTSGEVTAETDSSSYVTVDGTDTTKATVTLTNTLTSITVSKVDKDNQSTYLTGAVFDVALSNGNSFDASNVTVTSGSSVSSTGSSVTSFTLDMGTNSTVTISGLPAGEYTLTETTAPAGYVVSSTQTTMTVSGNGTSTGVTITNSRTPTAQITVNKVNEGGNNLAGAKFTLTATSGGSSVNLSGVSATNAASYSYSNYTVTFTTGTSDITLTGLPDGTYTLTESAMSGYTTVDPVTFTVSSGVVTYNSTITNVVYNSGTFTITNVAIPVQTASITIRKSYEDAAGNALSNSEASALEATFTLISDNTTSTPSYSETITITGNSTGTFDNLDYNGTYILSEASPTGYTATSPSGFPLTLNITSGVLGNGFSNNTVYVTNTATTTTTNTVTVSKRDMSNAVINTTDGSVATFTITGTGLDGVTIEVDGTTNTISGTSYTFSGTDAIFTDLPNGTYTLTEVAAPTGYEVVSTFTFTVTDGAVTVNSSTTTGDVKVNGTQIIVMDEVTPTTTTNTVTVSKRDMSNAVINTTDGSMATFTISGSGLVGSTISVDGGVAASITTDTYTFSGTDAVFTGLANGTYTLTEVAAPTGYEVVSTFTFTVTDGVVTVNSSTTTGDVKVNGTQIIVMDEVTASTGSGTSSTTTTTATSVTSDTTSATTSIVTTVTTIKPYTEPGWAQSFWAIATAHTTAEAVTIPEISEENPADLVSETVDAGAGIHSDSEESLIDESSPVTTVAVGSLAAALSALVMVLCRKFGKKTQKGAHSK